MENLKIFSTFSPDVPRNLQKHNNNYSLLESTIFIADLNTNHDKIKHNLVLVMKISLKVAYTFYGIILCQERIRTKNKKKSLNWAELLNHTKNRTSSQE